VLGALGGKEKKGKWNGHGLGKLVDRKIEAKRGRSVRATVAARCRPAGARVPDLGVTLPKTYHLGYTPRWAGGKTPIAGALDRGAHRRSTGELDGIIQVY
jgi:hypothetical protein